VDYKHYMGFGLIYISGGGCVLLSGGDSMQDFKHWAVSIQMFMCRLSFLIYTVFPELIPSCFQNAHSVSSSAICYVLQLICDLSFLNCYCCF
jgi:hypothetical protein